MLRAGTTSPVGASEHAVGVAGGAESMLGWLTTTPWVWTWVLQMVRWASRTGLLWVHAATTVVHTVQSLDRENLLKVTAAAHTTN